MSTFPSHADMDRMNVRIRQLVGEGFPSSEAIAQAREESPLGDPYDWLGDRVKLTLLRAPDDVSHQHDDFQAEIKEINSALKDTGVDAEALWLTQDSVEAWCGYAGAILIGAGSILRAASPIIVAYMKRRSGRKVQIECDGFKLKIEEATTEEVNRALTLIEQRRATKQLKNKKN